jgi:hypothetical protein
MQEATRMRRRRRPISVAAVGGLVAWAVLGATVASPARRPCGDADLAAGYQTKGKALVGDVDGDSRADRVTLRVDRQRPRRCRHLLVVRTRKGTTVSARVKPLPWPGTDPRLLLLAEIDGRAGLEPVLALTSPAAVYRPGAVFTKRHGKLARMRLGATRPSDLFPFYDEFPSGVDCAAEPGTIIATSANVADNDAYWDIKRSLYRRAGIRVELVREERFQVKLGPEAKRRWPELRGDPFLSCPRRVD